MSSMMSKTFASFREFYPYYLGEHGNRVCRGLHFVGSALVLAMLAAMLVGALSWWWFFALPVVAYGFAWVGHFVFEKNRPATFIHPVWSFMGDWVMFKDMLIGRIRF